MLDTLDERRLTSGTIAGACVMPEMERKMSGVPRPHLAGVQGYHDALMRAAATVAQDKTTKRNSSEP